MLSIRGKIKARNSILSKNRDNFEVPRMLPYGDKCTGNSKNNFKPRSKTEVIAVNVFPKGGTSWQALEASGTHLNLMVTLFKAFHNPFSPFIPFFLGPFLTLFSFFAIFHALHWASALLGLFHFPSFRPSNSIF